MSESKKDIFETYYARKLYSENFGVIGYKIIPPDWTCKGKKYECPGSYFELGMPICGSHGMHFCADLLDCFAYYPQALSDPNYHVCKVSAIGYISTYGNNPDSLMCTSELKILSELTQEEINWEFNQAAEFNKVPILLDGGLNENNNHRV